MIVVAYQRTMAGAKRIAEAKQGEAKRERNRLFAASRRWMEQHQRAGIEERTHLANDRRQWLIEQSPVAIPILDYPSPAALIEQVAFWHGVTPTEIIERSHSSTLVEARFDAIAAIAVNCRIAGRLPGLKDISRHMGYRHHTTILSALWQRGIVPRVTPGAPASPSAWPSSSA